MSTIRRLWRSGNSVVVAMPQDVMDHLNVSPGDNLVFIKEKGKRITIRRSYNINRADNLPPHREPIH